MTTNIEKYFFTLTPDTVMPIRVPYYSVFASLDDAKSTDFDIVHDVIMDSALTDLDSGSCVKLFTNYMGFSTMCVVDFCICWNISITVYMVEENGRFNKLFDVPNGSKSIFLKAENSDHRDRVCCLNMDDDDSLCDNLKQYAGKNIMVRTNAFDSNFITLCQICCEADISLDVCYKENTPFPMYISWEDDSEEILDIEDDPDAAPEFYEEDEEEDCSDIKFPYRISNGVIIVNTTPHSIRFQDDDDFLIDLPSTEGYIINASVEEEPVSPLLVRTTYKGNEEGLDIIKEIEAFFEHHFGSDKGYTLAIVGSVIAAQAYPGKVVSMCPVPGYERVAPSEKRMRSDKFVTFG